MPSFILADFLATGETWLAHSPGVLALALFIAAVVAWIALVRWLEKERAMLTPRKPGSGRNAASLNNLRLRHGKNTTPAVVSVSASIAEVGVANG